jgi:hypothetical protein
MPGNLTQRTWINFRGGLEQPRPFLTLVNSVKGMPRPGYLTQRPVESISQKDNRVINHSCWVSKECPLRQAFEKRRRFNLTGIGLTFTPDNRADCKIIWEKKYLARDNRAGRLQTIRAVRLKVQRNIGTIR